MYTAEAVADELSGVVRRAAEPIDAGDLVTEQIRRAARRLGLPWGQVKRLWYRECRTIPAHIALWLLEYDRRAELLHGELEELRVRIAALREL